MHGEDSKNRKVTMCFLGRVVLHHERPPYDQAKDLICTLLSRLPRTHRWATDSFTINRYKKSFEALCVQKRQRADDDWVMAPSWESSELVVTDFKDDEVYTAWTLEGQG